MQVREFLSDAVRSIVFLFLLLRSVEANSQNAAIYKDGKVTVNLDDLVIEVTPPRGRESLLNTEPFYEQLQKEDDDIVYWESIYGSMDNIPAFEDLPEIAGETFELKYVRESEEESFNEKDAKKSNIEASEEPIEKSSNRNDGRKALVTRELTNSKENKPSTDRCEWINPFYPREKLSGRQRRETTPAKKNEESEEFKRKARTLSLLHGESAKSRLKSVIHSNRRSDYLYNKYGRKHYRTYKSGHGSGSMYDCPENDYIIGTPKSMQFVDSAINAAELVNSNCEREDTGQVVANTIVNAARQLAQAKHDVIDLGLGGGRAIDSRSLNNAATDDLVGGVHAGEANIDSGLEVVGNSVLDTNSGIINEYAGTADGIEASLDTETKAAEIGTAVETLVDNDVREAELVRANLEENADGEAETASDVVADSNSELVADADPQGDIETAENTPEILDAVEIVGEPPAISTEDYLKLGNNDAHQDELVGANLEENGNTATEVSSDVNEEVPKGVESNPNQEELVGTNLEENQNTAAEDVKEVAPEVVIGDAITSKTIEDTANSDKSGADEIVGSILQINPKSGVQASINSGISTNLKADINIGKNRQYENTRPKYRREDLSCECGGSSDEDECYSREYYPGTYYDRRREFQDRRNYDRRFPEGYRYHPNYRNYERPHQSGLRANSGISTSLDTGIDRDSNSYQGSKSLQAGTAASLDIHSNLDIATSSGSGIHLSSNIQKSSGASLDINTDQRGGNIQTGAKSSLDIDSRLDIGHRTRTRPDERPDFRDRSDFDSNEDNYDWEESEEDREYRRRFPESRRYPTNNRNQDNADDFGIRSSSGIQSSLNAELNVNTDLRAAGRRSGLHANSGVHTSLDAGVDLNSDVSAGHLRVGSGRSSDVTASRSGIRDGNYRSYESPDDSFSEYDEYDEEREDRRRFPENSYADRVTGYREIKSGIAANSGIHTSLDTAVDINSAGAAGGLRAGAKSSLDLESHLDIGTATSGVNGANHLHLPAAINSRIRADGGIHTSRASELEVNAGGHLHAAIKSSLELNSHSDIATETNGPRTAEERSRNLANINAPNGNLGEKICDAACRRISDSREDAACPSSRLDDTYDERSEYSRRRVATGRGEGAYYMCDNCRRRLNGGIDSTCSICGGFNDYPFDERRQFLSSGTIYHFDGPKQNCKRTADSVNTCGTNHHINLDANCTNEAMHHSPDCQGLDYDLQTPRDGNPVPLGFVRAHLSHGHDIALDMHDRARSLVAGGLHPSPHTASMLHFFQSKVPDDLVKLNEQSELTLFGTKLLQHKLSVDYNITPNTFLEFLNHHGFRVTGDKICRGRRKRCGGCDNYRSLDGSCNNVQHPTWGQSNKAFARILPARYSDGIHGMPVSVTGGELPNPRKLSVRLYSRSSKLDPELTLAVVQWGQTLAHDLARQVMDQTTKGGIECCGNNGKSELPKSLQHHSCAPISISPRDKFYSSHGQRCMNFVRAMTVAREDCTLGPADQLNGATSFLDCSPMYGVDKTTSDELREFSGGRMKVEFRSGRWMLPTNRNHSNFCDIWTSDDVCYNSGDPRTNQNPQLVILQTLLVREHNRIADGLSALNPDWNDERIFQESRRIVIAEYQHITYNEWLPLLLGKRYCKRHGLVRTERGMSNDYNEQVNPSTIIGFTSGAFRSLHSMIEGDLGLCNVDGEVVDNIRLSDHYFRPRFVEKSNNFEHLLRGLTRQRMQKQNMQLHSELTEYLFRSRNDYGMDLAAIDIQRGRDHGVPSYNAYRKICRLQPAEDFDDLSEEISWENIEKLRRDYAHVDDIDLIVGAMMENRAPGSHFGPTNRCLIGEQFYRSRVGDRFFYDNEKFPHSFTPEQYDEIKKVSVSRLMCDMGGAVAVVQRYAFRRISSKNPLVPCEDLPKLDLTFWIE